MSMPNSRPPLRSIPISFVVTVVFMILLWIAVPVAWLTWLLVLPWQSGPHVPLRDCLQWFVVNLMAFLQRGVFGWLIREPSVDYVPWHRMGRLTQ